MFKFRVWIFDIHSGFCADMSYHGGQCFDVHAVFQCHGGEGMAEIVKAHPLAVCAFQYLLKPMINRRRVSPFDGIASFCFSFVIISTFLFSLSYGLRHGKSPISQGIFVFETRSQSFSAYARHSCYFCKIVKAPVFRRNIPARRCRAV